MNRPSGLPFLEKGVLVGLLIRLGRRPPGFFVRGGIGCSLIRFGGLERVCGLGEDSLLLVFSSLDRG